jgi:hypothetical protein
MVANCAAGKLTTVTVSLWRRLQPDSGLADRNRSDPKHPAEEGEVDAYRLPCWR